MKMIIDERMELVDQLLIKHKISLLDAADFANEHIKELEQAKNIFDLKEERDEKLCLALFRLMAGKYAADISKSFCERYNITDSSVDEIFFEKNKLFLIAAFIYNPSFFAMSWNLCGIIMSQLAYQAEMQEDVQKQETGKVIVVDFQQNIEILSASRADEVLQPIWSEDIDRDGIQGELQIRVNNKDNAGMVQFRFKFKEYHSEPPYYLRVHYKTNNDNIEHTAELNVITVNNADNRELIIASARQDSVRYEGGLTITSLEVQKNG
jgi:hypothetical protein